MKRATFNIKVVTEEGIFQGTGFFISEDGLALTNNHVLNRSALGAVFIPFGEDGKFDETNIWDDYQIKKSFRKENTPLDYTIFKVNVHGEKVPYLPIALKHIQEGEHLAKLGCGNEMIYHFATGSLAVYYTDDAFLVHSIPTNPGDSGCPVVDKYGRVIGINQGLAIIDDPRFKHQIGDEKIVNIAPGQSLAVDIDYVRKVMDEEGIKYGRYNHKK